LRAPRTRVRALAITFAAITTIALSIAPTSSGTAPHSPPYLATANSHPAPSTIPDSAFRIPHSGIAEAAPVSTNSSNSVYFRQTAHYLKDAFLNYWLMNGGVNIYGYPVSEEIVVNGVPMQYFERSRFEYRPNSARPWKVELSNVGSMVTEGRDFPPVTNGTSTGDRVYYEQTKHTLGGAFGQFWRASGGLDIFGYPISEEMREGNSVVQYFERARFELTAQGRVQLGHLGADLLKKQLAGGLDGTTAAPQARPGFNMSFRGEATVFNANWDRVISLNKSWGNLPDDYVGYGLYAAAPADLHLYGRWARVTRGNRSIFVQFIDVINWPDIPYVRSKGIVIDLGQEAFDALGQYRGGRYEVSFDVFWPENEPNR
jgi:hypothetical protein